MVPSHICDECRFRSANRLSEEEQADGVFDGGESLRHELPVGFLKQRHGRLSHPGEAELTRQKLKRSSNAFRASSVRGVVVSRSTVVRAA